MESGGFNVCISTIVGMNMKSWFEMFNFVCFCVSVGEDTCDMEGSGIAFSSLLFGAHFSLWEVDHELSE